MPGTGRVFLSVVMLLGFVAAAVVELLIWVGLFLGVMALAGRDPFAPIGWLILVVALIGGRLVMVLGFRRSLDPALQVGPYQVPELWRLVGETAAVAGTRAPGAIHLTAHPRVDLWEDIGLPGLRGKKRRLYIGMPLVHALNVDQLRAVLAVEFAHYSTSGSRLGPIAYRGRRAVGFVLADLHGFRLLVGWSAVLWNRLYQRVDRPLAEAETLAADRLAVHLTGTATAIATLRELQVVDAAWDHFTWRYVDDGWAYGYAPEDLFGGFGQFWAARRTELDELRAEPAEGAAVAERVAAMQALPPVEHPTNHRPAATLVPWVREAGMALQRQKLDVGWRAVLPWDEFARRTWATGAERGVHEAPGGLDGIRAGQAPVETLRLVLGQAAVRSEAGQWRLNWGGDDDVVTADGTVLTPALAEIAGELSEEETREAALAKLTALGVRLEALSTPG